MTADDGGSKFIVLFRTCAAAASCAQTRCLFELDLPARTSAAPHPRDVLWTNLYAPAARQQLVYFASRAALFALMLFWGSLVAFVQVRQEYTGQRRPQPKSQARRPARRPARRLTLPFLQGVVSLDLVLSTLDQIVPGRVRALLDSGVLASLEGWIATATLKAMQAITLYGETAADL